MTELKPCPFCGSGDAPRLMTRHGKDGWRDRYYVLCDYSDGGCGSSSGWYHSIEEAIGCWNRRENGTEEDGRNESGMCEEPKLKPCQYCRMIRSPRVKQNDYGYYVECRFCGIKFKPSRTKREAITRWNDNHDGIWKARTRGTIFAVKGKDEESRGKTRNQGERRGIETDL